MTERSRTDSASHADAKSGGERGQGDGQERIGHAREVAAEVLVRVWTDGAYAAPTLDACLRRTAHLEPRDAALATELVYGVLRTATSLERAIGKYSDGDRYRRKPDARAHFLIAVYSLRYLERVPAFAAVSEAVTAIKRAGGPQLAGFANAVLRKIAREELVGARDERLSRAVLESLPAWLSETLTEALRGTSESLAAFVGPRSHGSSVSLCLRAGEGRDEWRSRLREALPAAEISLGALSARCLTIRGGGDPAGWPGADEAWRVQEEGAQLIALSVGAKPGHTVLDACAGRGNKTLLLAEAVGSTGAVDAADRHPQKLIALRAAEAKLRTARHPHLPIRDTASVDWTLGAGEFAQRSYDRILVDAPCTGVGTLRHRPEIAERLAASDVERLAALQLAITARAATLLRPGGSLVYAVCSVLALECEGVVEALVRTTELEPCPFADDAIRKLAGERHSMRLLSGQHGTDGYFLAALRRR
ncbi:MAG: Sun protein [Myxococcales bacterium]|nr:Sun protein [Myxococcales bacterium]